MTAGGDPDLRGTTERLRADAVALLTDLAAGTSLCAIGRSGRSFPGGKYHEGRVAAATAVLRALDADPDPATALSAARSRWARLSPPLLRTGSDGQAYGEGGDDLLAELTEGLPALDAG